MVKLLALPIIGGFIGYFTNYIAVKMLFRPTKPYYLFGRRIPFTPGLIPSKKEKLAEAIARVVKENLLTEEEIRKRLNEEEVFKNLKELIENVLSNPSPARKQKFQEKIKEGIVSLNGKTIETLTPTPLKREFEIFIDRKSEEIGEKIANLIKEKEFESIVYSYINSVTKQLLSKIPLLPPYLVENLVGKISEKILESFSSTDKVSIQAKISKLAWKKLQEITKKEIKISEKDAEKVSSLLSELFFKTLESKKSSISEAAARELLKIIEKELPVILQSLNLELIVKEKISSLPPEEVEEIVLKLIKEELNYITLLGGILGTLIGLAQVLLFL